MLSCRVPTPACLRLVRSVGKIALRGLYETLVTRALRNLLTQLADGLSPATEALRSAEIADRLAMHVGRAVQRVLDDASERDRLRLRIELVDQLLKEIADRHGVSILDELLPESGLLLKAIVGRTPDGSLEVIQTPLIPLLDTALLTNAPGEPRLGSQVLAEVHSADRIDLVMAFVRRSGIKPTGRPRNHCSNGRGLRVLTTTYTGSTEVEALDVCRILARRSGFRTTWAARGCMQSRGCSIGSLDSQPLTSALPT